MWVWSFFIQKGHFIEQSVSFNINSCVYWCILVIQIYCMSESIYKHYTLYFLFLHFKLHLMMWMERPPKQVRFVFQYYIALHNIDYYLLSLLHSLPGCYPNNCYLYILYGINGIKICWIWIYSQNRYYYFLRSFLLYLLHLRVAHTTTYGVSCNFMVHGPEGMLLHFTVYCTGCILMKW